MSVSDNPSATVDYYVYGGLDWDSIRTKIPRLSVEDRMLLAENPIREELQLLLAQDPERSVRETLAQSKFLKKGTILALAKDREPSVKRWLAKNQDIVLPVSVQKSFLKEDNYELHLLTFLGRQDLTTIEVLEDFVYLYAPNYEQWKKLGLGGTSDFRRRLVSLGNSMLPADTETSHPYGLEELLLYVDEVPLEFKIFVAKWSTNLGLQSFASRMSGLPEKFYRIWLFQIPKTVDEKAGFMNVCTNEDTPVKWIEELVERESDQKTACSDGYLLGDLIEAGPHMTPELLTKISNRPDTDVYKSLLFNTDTPGEVVFNILSKGTVTRLNVARLEANVSFQQYLNFKAETDGLGTNLPFGWVLKTYFPHYFSGGQ